jgi:hypothetical protein
MKYNLSKRQISMNYSSDDEIKVNEIIEEIDSDKLLTRNGEISEFETIIFFISKKYLKSVEFNKDFESVKYKKKIILILIIEKIEDDNFDSIFKFNDFTIINFTESKNEAKNQLKIFLCKLTDELEWDEVCPFRLFYKRLIENKLTCEMSQIISKDEILTFSQTLCIINFRTGKLITEIQNDLVNCDAKINWIGFLSQIIWMENKSEITKLYFKNGILCQQMNLCNRKGHEIIRSIQSNEKTEEIYIHLFDYNSCHTGELIYIFDKSFNLIKKYLTIQSMI